MQTIKHLFTPLGALALAGLLFGAAANMAYSQIYGPGDWYANRKLDREIKEYLYRQSYNRYYSNYRNGYYDHGYDSRAFPGTSSRSRFPRYDGYRGPHRTNIYGIDYYREDWYGR